MTWLSDHYDTQRAAAAQRAAAIPLNEVATVAARQSSPRHVTAALRHPNQVSVIAEIKFRSPSQGVLRASADVETIAVSYARHGAAMLSVLIDETHFDGHLDYVTRARTAVDLPVLAKGFLSTTYEVVEARAAGADAVLLIAGCLEPETLADMHQCATDLGMAALVEVHDVADLDATGGAAPSLIGVNHRNLTTLDMDMGLTERIAPKLPVDAVRVAESGLRTAADLARMHALGYQAVLMGTGFMTHPDPGLALRDTLSGKTDQNASPATRQQ